MASASARHLHRSGSSSSTSKWWRGKDSNLRRRKPADLQSAPVGRLGTPPQNEPRILISGCQSVNASWPVICLGDGRREAGPPPGAGGNPPPPALEGAVAPGGPSA